MFASRTRSANTSLLLIQHSPASLVGHGEALTNSDGSGRFYYGGKGRSAPVGFGSGDEVSAVVDRHTHSGNGNGNGMVRFLRNGKALMSETERPLPIAFPGEAVFVVSSTFEGRSARIVRFE